MFFLNVPFALLTLLLAVEAARLGRPRAGRPARFDFPGVRLITGGSVAVAYGLAEIGKARASSPAPRSGRLDRRRPDRRVRRPPTAGGHPARGHQAVQEPDVLGGVLTNFCLGAAVFGAIILMPLYFQIVRQEDAVTTGPCVLIPRGRAAAMVAGAKLTDLTSAAAGWP